MGINVKDHPSGIPHSDGNVMEKFANGNVTSSRDTPYKHQARDALKQKRKCFDIHISLFHKFYYKI